MNLIMTRYVWCLKLILLAKDWILSIIYKENFIWSHLKILININRRTLILKIMSQCDVSLIMTLPINAITAVLKFSTHIITSFTSHPIGLSEILTITSVSTFKTAVILFSHFPLFGKCISSWNYVIRKLCLYFSVLLPLLDISSLILIMTQYWDKGRCWICFQGLFKD
jgi:hypothetical protein